MANVNFTNLNQAFGTTGTDIIEFTAASGLVGGFDYSYTTTGGDDWEFAGSGITTAANLPTGGTVTAIQLDLDDDNGGAPEIIITGLGDVPIVDFSVGAGTAVEQRDRFWAAALADNDTITFDLADFTQSFRFAGDGADASNGGLYSGGNDSFLDAGTALINVNSWVLGDFSDITNGSNVVGGDDIFTLGANVIVGDANIITDGGLIGGDDIITPARLAGLYTVALVGDAASASNSFLVGGDDLIDLRSTDLTALAADTALYGDVSSNSISGMMIGGSDTIYGGETTNDIIFGDWANSSGYAEGGKDYLYGLGGDDTIYGNSGRDLLVGYGGGDVLLGGDDGDIIRGFAGQDTLSGDAGNDSMEGGQGDDVFLAGSGRDTLNGEEGNDSGDAAAGNDVINGGTGKDNFFGGTGADIMNGDGGNDTLSGGDQNDTLLGGGGYDALLGGNDNDVLNGGDLNDILIGGAGFDTFQFAVGGDTDTIRDFAGGAGITDVIQLIGFGAAFDSFAEVMAAATDNGAHTTINFGGGNVLIVENTVKADFAIDDFLFS